MTSEIDSLPLCCIFVWPETPVLMISPAAFVHLLQTKPMRVNWLLPTQAVCCDEAQRENNQGCLLLGVISENMCRDKLNNVMGEKEKKEKNTEFIKAVSFFWACQASDNQVKLYGLSVVVVV